jgi:hypothetical protein
VHRVRPRRPYAERGAAVYQVCAHRSVRGDVVKRSWHVPW